MAEEGPALFTQDSNTNEYVPYTAPEPKPFMETLDEDLRGSEHLKGFENANDLAKTLVEVKSAQPVIPETAEAYTYEVKEGEEVDAERLTKWKSALHGFNISQAQFEGILGAALAEEAEGKKALDEAHDANRAESESALQTKWGDKYEENVEGALKFCKAISTYMPDEGKGFAKFMEDTKFGDNPQVVEFMQKCSTLISEDVIQRGSPRAPETKGARSESGDPMIDEYKDMDKPT